jgi:glutamine synthetase
VTTPPHLGVMGSDEIDRHVSNLRGASVRLLRGTFADAGGVLRGKQVPINRAGAFHSPGLGASPVWVIFCIDDGIAFTPNFGAVGDMRLRADLEAAVDLGDGVAWAPLELFDQDGAPMAFCPRGTLRGQQAAAEADGLSILAAAEIELVLFDGSATSVAGSGGPAYGLRPLMEQGAFLDDVHRDFDDAGLAIEQLHAEYGSGQIELSIAPAGPLQAADANVLARILLCRAARRHGLAVSFSPKVFAEGIGNGAHVHMSFWRGTEPLLSGGNGPHGLTDDGGAIIGGLVKHLPDVVGALAPSLLSDVRLQPGHWSGAFACWGLENREAAVRLVAGTSGNPRGANVEVKCIDASANPYIANAVLLGVARKGLADHELLPAETTVDPGSLSDDELAASGIVRIGGSQAESLDALEASAVAQDILGAGLMEALLAVRRHEVEIAKEATPAELVERFRFAWSV